MGAEEGAGGRDAGRGEVQKREEAVLGTQCMPLGRSMAPLGRDPESGRWSGPSGHVTGEGVWGQSCAAAVATSPGDQAETRQVPALPLPVSTNQKPQVEKGDSFFLSQKGRLKETTDCKLPSLL